MSVPASTSAASSATCSGVASDAASVSCAFARRVSSPVHHLRAAAGDAPGRDGLGDLDEQTAVHDVLELEVGEAPFALQAAAVRRRRLGQLAARSSSMSSRDGSTGSRSGSGKYR